ncbi:hypothetical protein, partial [Alistipes senegalensis]|uniref:hypothetical protein n=1 Tax=Alistipes senegalensis TaxID=1288121 RepID=UPI001E38DB49
MLKEFIDDLRWHGIAVFDLIQTGAGNHIFFARRNGHTWGIRISRERAARCYTVHIFSEELDIRGTCTCPPRLLPTTIELRWKIQCKLPPKTKAILPPCAKIILPP